MTAQAPLHSGFSAHTTAREALGDRRLDGAIAIETLASIDDAAAMAGWFGAPRCTTRRHPVRGARGDSQDRRRRHRADADTVLTPGNLVLAAVGTLSRARLGELRQVVTDWR